MTDACAEFMQAVELNPQFGKAHLMKGVCLDRDGNDQAAMVEYQTALGVGMDFMNTAVTHFDLGLIYSRKGEKPLAIQEFQSALTANPDNHEARWALRAEQAPNAFVAAYWNFLIYVYSVCRNHTVIVVMFVAFIILYPLTRIKTTQSISSKESMDQLGQRNSSEVAKMEANRLSDQQIQELQSRNRKTKFAAIGMMGLLWALIAVPNSFLREHNLPFLKELILVGLPLLLVSYLRRLQKCPSCGEKLSNLSPTRCSSCGVNISTDSNAGGVDRPATRSEGSRLSDEQIQEFQSRKNKVKNPVRFVGIAGMLIAVLSSRLPKAYHLGFLPYVMGLAIPLIALTYVMRLRRCPSCSERLPSLSSEQCPHCQVLLR